jgi:aryl-alcohol dehydrogenase-like predicted oxidoreductase
MDWMRIGLGCWQLGDDCWGDVNEETATKILGEALDSGINFFDTADVYGSGLSETRIGNFLKTTTEPIFVATKLGRFSDPGWPENFTEQAIRQHTEASLKRLGVEALDLTQLHCIPKEELERGDVFESLRKLQTEGKIKAFGASIESIEEGHICLKQPGLASLQVIFNPLRQKPAETLLPAAHAQGVKIIVRLPLASGALSGKYTANQQFPANDHRNFNSDGQAFHVGETFNGLGLAKAVELADLLKSDLPEGINLAEASLRWILDHKEVSTIIPGASKPGQVTRNAAALNLSPLPQSTHDAWAKIYKSQAEPLLRGNI